MRGAAAAVRWSPQAPHKTHDQFNKRTSAHLSGPGRPSWPPRPRFRSDRRRTSRRSGSPGSSSSLRGGSAPAYTRPSRAVCTRALGNTAGMLAGNGGDESLGGGGEMLARWAEISLRWVWRSSLVHGQRENTMLPDARDQSEGRARAYTTSLRDLERLFIIIMYSHKFKRRNYSFTAGWKCNI